MKKIIHIMMVIFLMAGCSGIYEDGKELALAVKPTVDQIKPDELKAMLEQDEAFYLIDVRTAEEFEEGYLNDEYMYNDYLMPVNLPRGILESKISDPVFWEDFFEDLPDKETTDIVVYCKDGNRGILAANTLLKLGYKNVRNLEGGYDQWVAIVESETE